MKSLAHTFVCDVRSHPRRCVLTVTLLVFLYPLWFYHDHSNWRQSTSLTVPRWRTFTPGIAKPPGQNYSQTLVVSHMKYEDVSWIKHELPALNVAFYAPDDPSAPLHPPTNKGHESMSYLTYIIDNYDDLADTNIFIHAHRTAWHNNDLFDFDMAEMLRRLSNEHVAREGFFNLRCHPESGCPAHINMEAKVQDPLKQEEVYFSRVWSELHGDDPMPKTLGAPCCSQFAASRERLRSVSLERWKKYRDWIINTELDDIISGRIWEFTWFYILTGKTTYCPSMNVCYCDGFGLCFGSLGRIEAWLNLKSTQYLAEEQLRQAEQQGRSNDVLREHLNLRITKSLKQRVFEALVKGDNPRNRALEAGRPWKEGDGF